MHKVMIVDDDVNIVEGLESTIDWDSYGYSVMGVAYNGKEGLEKILEEKPDVVITDITMPLMDGIEMVKLAKASLPELKVILLTCHADFSLAQKAIQLDVSEYILKETMEQEELYEALKKLSKQINDEAIQKNTIKEMSRERGKIRCIIGDWMINEVIDGKTTSYQHLQEMLENYSYKIKKERFILSVLEIDRYTSFSQDNVFMDEGLVKFAIINILEEMLEDYELCGVFSRSGKEYIILYNYDYSLKIDMLEKIKSISKEVQYNLKKFLKNTCTIYISEHINSIEEIPYVYKQFDQFRAARFYMQDGMLLDKKCLSASSKSEEEDKNDVYSNIVKSYESFMLEGDNKGIVSVIDEFVKKTCELKKDINFVKKIAIRMLIVLIDYLELYDQYQFEKSITKPGINLINEMDSIYEIGDMIKEHSLKAIKTYHESIGIVGNGEISKVLRYINMHMNEDISMDTMAQYACMNSSYFSRYFKSRTGENFTDYLSKLRVEKAKSLLISSNFTIDEISDMVGYVNKAYFMRVFKKFSGCTPGEFRKAKK